MSANYIYTEGKRLEAMSFRLLDIIVTKKNEVEFQTIPAESIFDYLQGMFGPDRERKFRFSYTEGTIYAEVNLIKTVLVNLIDNACKASETGALLK